MNAEFNERLEHLDVAAGLLDALRDDVIGELASFENRRLTRDEQDRQADLRQTLSQLESGVQAVWNRSEGTDPRLDALLRRHEITRLHLVHPCRSAIRQLRDRLIAERDAEEAAEADRIARPWPRRFTYTGPRFRHRHGDRDLEPGDEVLLTEAQAEGFADRFVAVETGEVS